MSLNLCFYFQVHQPWRLRTYRYAEVGHHHDYFDASVNSRIMRRVADKCYLPMNALLEELIRRYQPDFRVSFSITATALQQMQAYAPDALASFRRLMATGAVELLSETSHHSLAGLYSPREFAAQIALHREVCQRLLGVPGRIFRNTELIVSDAIARQVAALDYAGMCMEGADRVLRESEVLHPHRYSAAPTLLALARHYRLSDDIAFRFSNRGWREWPLTAERYVQWLENTAASGSGERLLGLFMDYETFGEHQWESTGIFDFMRALPGAVLARRGLRFVTPSEALERVPPGDAGVALPDPVSWADLERDTSAWTGNRIQCAAQRAVYDLESKVHAAAAGDAGLLEDWRRLLTSDHAYYMCTKYWTDGDVHKYFSHYDSPYDAYIGYMNVLADLAQRCAQRSGMAAA
ncbi:MAG: glycoside hydrolase family 57 protein [Gammaproteobacteria bacterium]|nr:glycoside hydrolase family 57 protein [Gammaproteobacteria bacterium]